MEKSLVCKYRAIKHIMGPDTLFCSPFVTGEPYWFVNTVLYVHVHIYRHANCGWQHLYTHTQKNTHTYTHWLCMICYSAACVKYSLFPPELQQQQQQHAHTHMHACTHARTHTPLLSASCAENRFFIQPVVGPPGQTSAAVSTACRRRKKCQMKQTTHWGFWLVESHQEG